MTKPHWWPDARRKMVPIRTADAGDETVSLGVNAQGIGDSDDKVLWLIGADGRMTPLRCVYNGDEPPTYSLSVILLGGPGFTAGAGLVLVGDVLNIVALDDSIDVQADGIRVNPALQRHVYTAPIGDGLNTINVVNHDLGAIPLYAHVRRNEEPYEEVGVMVTHIDENTANIYASPPLEDDTWIVQLMV